MVNGAPLTTLIHAFENSHDLGPADAYGGLVPSFFRFGPLDEHYLGRSKHRPGAKVPLLGCECGEWGCWPLLAHVKTTSTAVEWSQFQQPFRNDRDYSEFGPFVFSKRAYEDALTGMQQALEDFST